MPRKLSADAHAATLIDVHVVVVVVVVPAEIRFQTTHREWEKIVVGVVERAAVILGDIVQTQFRHSAFYNTGRDNFSSRCPSPLED